MRKVIRALKIFFLLPVLLICMCSSSASDRAIFDRILK